MLFFCCIEKIAYLCTRLRRSLASVVMAWARFLLYTVERRVTASGFINKAFVLRHKPLNQLGNFATKKTMTTNATVRNKTNSQPTKRQPKRRMMLHFINPFISDIFMVCWCRVLCTALRLHLYHFGCFLISQRLRMTRTITIGMVQIPNVNAARKKHQAYFATSFILHSF